ncbi:MAG: hypothetical protein ACRCUP_05370 [Mycoplasmatales bacterium]
MKRGFERISGYTDNILPTRGTKKSAGYDFYTTSKINLFAGETKLIKTGIKAYMQDDEVLELYIRSSMGIKKGLRLVNCVGIIDADYYNNPDNEGHIMIGVKNESDVEVEIEEGERIAQGIFKKYLIIDNDLAEAERIGGIGSTK